MVNILSSYHPLLLGIFLILMVLFFNSFIKRILRRFQRKLEHDHKIWKHSFVAALYKPLSLLIWFMVLIFVVDILSEALFKTPFVYRDTILSIGLVLIFSWFLYRWNSNIYTDLLLLSRDKKISLTHGNIDLLNKIATIAISFLTLFLIMDVTGRSVQTLIAVGGIGGVALAFASQQFISNFFGGLMIYLTHPFSLGENIILPEKKIEGHIEEIGWYSTLIRDKEKKPVYIPNANFSQSVVINTSRMTHERIHMKLPLSCKNSKVLKEVIDEINKKLTTNIHLDQHIKPEVYLINLEQDIEVEISAYIHANQKDIKGIKQQVLFTITDILNEKGIEVTPSNPTCHLRR